MQGQCMVAVYSSRDNAEQAYRALLDSGFADDHVRISNTDAYGAGATGGTTGSVAVEKPSSGVWDWLFGSSVPEEHQRLYETRLAGGHIAVSVLVEDAPAIANTSAVEDILERYEPLDLHCEDGFASGSAGSSAAAPGSDVDEQERTIPLPEEQLKVGKRATESVRHVRTYVVEEPVEQDVTLHDERVVIEKRPATGGVTGEPAEREYEVRERHEEPVVEKSADAGEELVIRKEADDRTEHIRDTVRKTKVDIKGKRD